MEEEEGGGQQPTPSMDEPPIYNPMNQPPFSNPQAPPREMPTSSQQYQQPTSLETDTSELDALLSNISNTKDLGNEKEITLDLKM